ncbi:MAG: GAF domain-containing sensor histidine kinase [Fimbriimonadaceae bacterium]|nr:GAF domain-containing sensor histidine kinase [Fimbriimonadaceae bacterium]
MNPKLTPLLDAVHLATRKLASSRKLNDVLPEVLSICVEAVGAEGGTIYLHNRTKKALEFRHVLPERSREALQFSDIPDHQGVAGAAFTERRTQLTHTEPVSPRAAAIAEKTGMNVRTMITVPLMLEDTDPIGVVQLVNKQDGDVFTDDDRTVLETVSAVSTLAYLNWELLDEQTRASQLLGMGRVAHDIKNMAFALEANLTFSHETMKEIKKLAGKDDCDPEMVPHVDTLDVMINELHESIDRIKDYTTLMSDLSAGKKLEPKLVLAPMSKTIERAASFLASEARKHGLELNYEIEASAPATKHDSMYVFRITQNLVSNAVKAVAETMDTDPDMHEAVTVRYSHHDDKHVLEVVDTGPGMTKEIADRILGGNARSVWNKSAGSGWGTKIVLELAQTHGATVEIDSELGRGSTFRVTFPHRA